MHLQDLQGGREGVQGLPAQPLEALTCPEGATVKSPPEQTEHDQLLTSLAEHLRQGGKRVVLEQPMLGSRWGLKGSVPIPDVLAIRKSYTQREVAIYEVKANRADYAKDLNTGKWERYLPKCNRFFFAAPAGLLRRDDVPPGCGLVVFGKGWMTVTAPVPRPDAGLEEDELLSIIFAQQKRALRVRSMRERDIFLRELLDECAQEGAEKLGRVLGKEIAEKIRGAAIAKAKAQSEARTYRKLTAEVCEALGFDPDTDHWKVIRGVKQRLAHGMTAELGQVLRRAAWLIEGLGDGAGLLSLAQQARALGKSVEELVEATDDEKEEAV